MNYAKIQQELLAYKLNKGFEIYYGRDGAEIFLTQTGRVGYFIPEAKVLIDLFKCSRMPTMTVGIEPTERNRLRPTGIIKVRGTTKELELTNARGTVYVDKALLKYFDSTARFYQIDPKRAIAVYEGEGKNKKLRGIVHPSTK